MSSHGAIATTIYFFLQPMGCVVFRFVVVIASCEHLHNPFAAIKYRNHNRTV